MSDKYMGQKEQVLSYLQEHAYITGAIAFSELGIYRLSSCINRLRKDGITIITDNTRGYAKYSLLEEGDING